MFLITDGCFVLHQQLHHHLVVAIHYRRLCKSPNILWARSTQVVAAATGSGRRRPGKRLARRLASTRWHDAVYGCGGRPGALTRVNSTNVLDEGLRIGEIGRRMNSKVKLVKIGVCRK
jgi:hypothetical protein